MQDNKLYVGNLHPSVTRSQLEELFSQYGGVKNVNRIAGKDFGFIEMSSPEDAQKAKDALNNVEFEERVLKVDNARQPDSKPRRDFRRY